MGQKYIVDGFQFNNAEDAKTANEELVRINAIHSKIDSNNLAALKALYLKAVEQNVFETQIGISYLKNLRDYLISNGAINKDEYPLPVLHSKNAVSENRKEIEEEFALTLQSVKQDYEKKISDEQKKKIAIENSLKKRNFMCVLLVILVICMFLVTLTGKNPNIINYKNAIANQYAEWDQQLKDRESRIREKEADLGISEDNSQN